jgi:hypothetical protein
MGSRAGESNALPCDLSAPTLATAVDCAKRISAGETDQVEWLIAIALTQVFGAGAYFVFGRNARREINRDAFAGLGVLPSY